MKKIAYLVLLLVMLVACEKKAPEKDVIYQFKEYIFSTTSGLVSKSNPIEIIVTQDIVGFEVGSEIPADIVEIKPKVTGKLVLESLKKLVFIPEDYLKSDTEYSIALQLGKVFTEVPKEKQEFHFSFKTIAPNFTVNTKDLQSYTTELQYLDGVVKSADVISLKEAKQLLVASQDGKQLPIKWHGDEKTSSVYFDFVIDSISRQKNDSKVLVKWDGSVLGLKENVGESFVTIPGKNNFSVMNVYVRQSPEQHLRINFSDPLKKQQNLKGLVAIQNAKSLKYVVEGNVLKVYPKNRISGAVKVDIFTGIKNSSNYKLQKQFSEKVTFEQIKPAVQLITNGLILPDSENLKFNFKAVNLKAVDVEVIKIYADNILQFLQEGNLSNSNRYDIKAVGRPVAKKTIPLVKNDLENDGKWKNYAVDLSNLIATEPGAIYRVELSFDQVYSLFSCEGTSENVDYTIPKKDAIALQNEKDRDAAYWDGFASNHYYEDYNWRDRDNPCTPSYYYNQKTVGANILASNLGVIVKKGSSNTYFFAVTSILTTAPIAEAKVELYNYQQQSIGVSATNEDGITLLDLDAQAAFAVISKGNEKTYVKLNEGNSLSLSKFNVAGKRIKKGLKGYVYAERGVWRPGDTIHSVFVLNDAANPIPQGHPIKMEVTDPHGKLKYQKVSTTGLNGFYRFHIPTDDGDATGNWNAKVSVGGATFYKAFKVETVKPNRLKINIDFKDDLLTTQKPIVGNIEVKWLHGATAKNLKTEVKMKLTPSNKGFEKFPSYVFKDPIKDFSTEELVVFDGNIDVEGKGIISKKVSVNSNAPGLLKATFLTRVFENGGDFSSDVVSKDLAPFQSFVGLKSPVSKRYGNSYVTGETIDFGIATVDNQGNPIARKNLEVELYKIRWSWWWNAASDNLASYVSKKHSTLYKSFKVTTNKQGTGVLNIKIPEGRSGRYLIRVKDPISGHATGRTAYFFRDWWSNSSEKNSESATMLVFSSDKEKYNVGEEATLTFPSGTEGNALISVENSSEVLETYWVKTKKGQTTASIPITAVMTPNVYINISLLQPHASVANDLPLRLYGVIPILVENEKTRLDPQIFMPDELEPESTFVVKVSEKSGKKMTYTLAVVEEGLLDLTRFRTPDLWNAFYTREALGVRTWDVFDEVIGAFGGTVNQVFSIGGDDEGQKKKSTKANRFKPVVTVLGPFELGAGKNATHKIKMPNYVGSVRTMLVAGDAANEAYGKAEKATPVRKPLMVLASLPRKLSPGEKVTLPVTVFAMKENVKDVQVSLKLSRGIKNKSLSVQSIHFDQPDEKMVYFDLDVQDLIGINTVEVIVQGNGERATQKVELDVVNPNPVSSKFIDIELQANQTIERDFTVFGDRGTNYAEIEVSTLPPMNFTKRLSYLIRYPHGCVEQTTSSVFPQLFLPTIFDLEYEKKTEIKENIEKGIKRLGKFQKASGGLSYWIGGASANDWGTSYAGHFMIEAQKKGFVLPLTFMSNWLRYQKETARAWRPSFSYRYSDVAQAYRLYTLALAGSPDLAAMNRLREFTNISNTAKWRLAAAYALAGQKEAAVQLAGKANYDFSRKYRDYYTYGSSDRNRAMAMETLLLLKDSESRTLAKTIAKRLSSDSWMSTQTTAYCLLSMAKMVELNGGKEIAIKYQINKSQSSIKTENTIAQRTLKISETSTNKFTITNNKDNVVYVRLINSGILPVGNEIAVQRNFKLYVKYVDDEAKPITFAKLKQGTDFMALVTLSNPNTEKVADIALTQIFPSGWEIVNTRFTDFGEATENKADYTDIRDDRVNFYFSLEKNETRTFKVLLNASYLGKYYLPGVQAEAMYDNDYFSRSQGRWIEVVK
ncbi:alpha-2-macroglobulin family protein [Flavicella sediminum]|uniref:alpha-2-macroglobulin family protein n=1 Tax=Flavicella sediminum TaxID=2585141 RepID=UPI00111F2EA2|nr:MG2 domain-containing protein [Flavicella sediminum]